MSQIVNALPDVNREDFTPDPVSYQAQVGANVSISDTSRNTALPDANQDKVLPSVQASTGSPLMADGRSEMITKRGDTGRIPTGKTELSVGPQYENVETTETYLHDDSDGGKKANTL